MTDGDDGRGTRSRVEKEGVCERKGCRKSVVVGNDHSGQNWSAGERDMYKERKKWYEKERGTNGKKK